MAIKQVVFDLGGVLVEWNHQRIVKMVTSDLSVQNSILEEIFFHPDWLELDKGSFPEKLAAEIISERSNMEPSYVMGVFDRVRESFESINDTRKVLEVLVESGIACFALSNMSVENYRYLFERHSFFEFFSGQVISGHE